MKDLHERRSQAMADLWIHCMAIAKANDLCPICLTINFNRQVSACLENGEFHHSNHDKEIEKKETIQ